MQGYYFVIPVRSKDLFRLRQRGILYSFSKKFSLWENFLEKDPSFTLREGNSCLWMDDRVLRAMVNTVPHLINHLELWYNAPRISPIFYMVNEEKPDAA